MKKLGIAVAVVLGLVLLILGGSVALIESGEVVVIHTRDADGGSHATRVWVLDHAGRQWVAPGNRTNAWFQRLLANPQLDMVREGGRACYVAAIVESPESIPVLERVLEKYASVIRVTTLLNFVLEPEGDDTAPVAVRLDPC